MNLKPTFKGIVLPAALVFILSATTLLPMTTRAATAAEIDRSAGAGLRRLYASTPSARSVGQRARAVLVFPSIIKGGFIGVTSFRDETNRYSRRIAEIVRRFTESKS